MVSCIKQSIEMDGCCLNQGTPGHTPTGTYHKCPPGFPTHWQELKFESSCNTSLCLIKYLIQEGA